MNERNRVQNRLRVHRLEVGQHPQVPCGRLHSEDFFEHGERADAAHLHPLPHGPVHAVLQPQRARHPHHEEQGDDDGEVFAVHISDRLYQQSDEKRSGEVRDRLSQVPQPGETPLQPPDLPQVAEQVFLGQNRALLALQGLQSGLGLLRRTWWGGLSSFLNTILQLLLLLLLGERLLLLRERGEDLVVFCTDVLWEPLPVNLFIVPVCFVFLRDRPVGLQRFLTYPLQLRLLLLLRGELERFLLCLFQSKRLLDPLGDVAVEPHVIRLLLKPEDIVVGRGRGGRPAGGGCC
mmetsp:Transcript_28173/g.71473  ORF Transcript_28173/g.71473 Transcript_28173/m.71473 type:complete len:291 (-) Transcript_28173:143-1015(-)